jgi:hypothetical protein
MFPGGVFVSCTIIILPVAQMSVRELATAYKISESVREGSVDLADGESFVILECTA